MVSKMKKSLSTQKLIQMICIILFIVSLLLGLLYIGLAVYYKEGFSYGTYINDVYCTGKTVDEVNQELDEKFSQNDKFTIYLKDSEKTIILSDVDYSYDFKEPLIQYMKQQNPFLWIEHVFNGRKGIEIYPNGVFDAQKFDVCYEGLQIEKEQSPQTVEIKLTDTGYQLFDGKQSAFQAQKAKETVYQALKNGWTSVNLVNEGCYEQVSYTNQEEKTLMLWNAISKFQKKEISIKFGSETRKITEKELADILLLDNNNMPITDENNELLIDYDKAGNMLVNLTSEYNTYENHYFTAHNGDTIYIPKGNYGNLIDLKKEQEWFFGIIDKEDVAEYEPVYIHEAKFKEKDDIGGTYIEVSIAEQKLFYFVNHELKLETDVVTGNTGRSRGTPQRVCFVYGKQKNRILRGPGYASFVNFWMPVSGNIGIHDAPWRDEFGGEIYKTAGSHGCINTPYDNMETLYNTVEIGTPVIIYDADDIIRLPCEACVDNDHELCS